MNSTGGSKIHHIKANPEPAFVPLTDEVRALPIQKGKWYMLASPIVTASPGWMPLTLFLKRSENY